MEGCAALTSVCYGTDAAGLARRQLAVRAGGRGAAAAAMQAHPGDAMVQRRWAVGDRHPWLMNAELSKLAPLSSA